MNEPTALWIWPDQYEPRAELTIGAAELDFVRTLAVWWDNGENGAAGLEASEGVDHPPKSGMIVDMFLNTARLAASSGVISNPYGENGEPAWRIEGAPDADIVAHFLAGDDIDYAPTPQDLALWAAANRTEEGINCKRPFGSESVARDLRPLLDPDKTLSNSAFGKLRRSAEARMLLFLQFFVQQANLPLGRYIRGKDYQWRPEAEVEDADGEDLPWLGWAERVAGIVNRQSADYVRTGSALTQLVWEGRITGDYTDLNHRLKLHNLYEDHFEPRYVGLSRDMAEAGVAAFDETTRPFEERVLTGCLVRILNGTGDFAAAKAAMQAAGIWGIDASECSLRDLNPHAVYFLEETIAAYGLREISPAGFSRRAHSSIKGGSSFIYDILHGVGIWAKGGPDDLPSYRVMRARAAASQISIMRGRV